VDGSCDCVGRDKIDTVLSVGSFADEVRIVWAEFRLSIPSDLFELFDRVLSDIVVGKGVLPFRKKDS